MKILVDQKTQIWKCVSYHYFTNKMHAISKKTGPEVKPNEPDSEFQSCDHDIDPITKDPINDHVSTFMAPNGKQIRYNPISISTWFISKGDTIDPVMKIDWSTNDLIDLESSLKLLGVVFDGGLIEKIKSRRKEMEREKIKFDSLYSLETCLGELISEIMQIIEEQRGASTMVQEFNLYLCLSQFELPFSEMKELDIEFSYYMWSSWLTFLKGPQPKPTNMNTCLKMALAFLTNQWSTTNHETLKLWRERSSENWYRTYSS